MGTVMAEITDVLAEPLDEHPNGLVAGLEKAAALITDRVEGWSATTHECTTPQTKTTKETV